MTLDGNIDGSPFMSMLGIQNALRTGNVFTDMILAMCIPFVLKIMFLWVEKLGQVLDIEYFLKLFERDVMVHERFISYTSEKDVWGGCSNLDEDTHNSLLLKAIQIYLHQVVKVDSMSAYLDLMVVNDGDDRYEYDDYGNVINQKTLTEQLSHYKILNRLPYNEWHDIGRYGKANGMVQLRIEYQQAKEGDEKNRNDNNAKKIESTTFHFTSDEKDAIDDFVDSAYTWYLGLLRKMEDNARYYYEMNVPEIKFGKDKNDNNAGSHVTYKRYKLSEEKTFDSLFFREKDNLLALIDHFAAKTGKYSIKGYPHKLGLLLHGPPGTGKTSLIKALAQYTGRSIVNVPLSRVTTNSELMSVFFDRKYQVDDSMVPVNLDFKDVIYVMEDCDAASKVVMTRGGESPTDIGTTESVTLPKPKSLWRLLLESTDEVCKEVVEKLLEVSERLKEEAEKERPKVLCSIAKRLNEQPALGLMDEASDDPFIFRACTDAMDCADVIKQQQSRLDEILKTHAEAIKMLLQAGAEVSDDFINELLGETRSLRCHVSPSRPKAFSRIAPSASPYPTKTYGSYNHDLTFDNFDEFSKKGKASGPSWFKPNPDALSLSGLLNVLDGVVDTPGRIVILTSNHPELLDPALIRPGRVDKTLKLGYMEAHDIVNMLELYYQTALSNSDVARVAAAVDGINGEAKSKLRMTPAQIEQLTAEHDQLEDMIRLLEEKSPLSSTKTGILGTEQQISCSRI